MENQNIDNYLRERHDTRTVQYSDEAIKDGEMDLPNIDDTLPCPTEMSIREDYNSDVNYLHELGLPKLDIPHVKYQSLKNEYATYLKNKDSFIENQLVILNEIKNEKSNDLDEKIKLQKDHLDTRLLREKSETKNNEDSELQLLEDKKKRILSVWQNSKDAFKRVSDKHNRTELQVYIKSRKVEISILATLGIAEVPLNYTVFANFLLSEIETYILSILLVISIPILSHFSGVFIRQIKENKNYKYILMAIVPFVTILNVAVGVYRSNYIQQMNEGMDTGFWNVFTFIMLGLLLYIVGVVISMAHTDKSHEFASEYKTKEKAQFIFDKEVAVVNKIINNVQEEFKALRKSIEKKYNNDLGKIEDEQKDAKEQILNEFNVKKNGVYDWIESTKNELIQVTQEYDTILNTYKGIELQVNANYKKCVQNYRTINYRNRNNHKRPQSWDKNLQDLELHFKKYLELDPQITAE